MNRVIFTPPRSKQERCVECGARFQVSYELNGDLYDYEENRTGVLVYTTSEVLCLDCWKVLEEDDL